MDFIADILGLNLPTMKARDSLRRSTGCQVSFVSQKEVDEWDCDQDAWDVPVESKLDDDTASTVSFSDDSSISPCVSFAKPLVTAVHLRPYTTRSEKMDLFYREADFRQFRMEYRLSLHKRVSTVQFADNLVTQVHTIPVVENTHEVYYSAAELKQ